MLLPSTPEDFRKLQLDGADLMHHWVDDRELKLLLYRERTTSERSAKALKILLGTTAVIAVLTIFEHLTGWSLGIDQLLARDVAPGPGAPGRMSFSTTIGLLLLSGSTYIASRPGRYAWAQGLCGAAIFLATLNGVTYVFGFDPAAGNAMAVHMAVCVLLLALGILFARPTGCFSWSTLS